MRTTAVYRRGRVRLAKEVLVCKGCCEGKEMGRKRGVEEGKEGEVSDQRPSTQGAAVQGGGNTR